MLSLTVRSYYQACKYFFSWKRKRCLKKDRYLIRSPFNLDKPEELSDVHDVDFLFFLLL